MQKTISFTYNKKKYVSKPFDFEAFCQINERSLSGEVNGIYRCTYPTVEYMFEGTEATDDILKALDVSTQANMCKKVMTIYNEILQETSKNE